MKQLKTHVPEALIHKLSKIIPNRCVTLGQHLMLGGFAQLLHLFLAPKVEDSTREQIHQTSSVLPLLKLGPA